MMFHHKYHLLFEIQQTIVLVYILSYAYRNACLLFVYEKIDLNKEREKIYIYILNKIFASII